MASVDLWPCSYLFGYGEFPGEEGLVRLEDVTVTVVGRPRVGDVVEKVRDHLK